MNPMENKEKAISQIKFPVRYDEGERTILDADDSVIIRFTVWLRHTVPHIDAFGHALAEMINGLDAEFDDAEEQYRQDIMSLAIGVANIFYYAGRKKEYADLPNDIAELFNGGELKYPTYPKRLNGLDGRGKEVAIPTDQCIEDWYGNSKVGDNSSELEWIKSAVKYFMGTWQGNSKPDRQVKSAEIPTNETIKGAADHRYYGSTYWHGVKKNAFREGAKWMKGLWKIYAQQYK